MPRRNNDAKAALSQARKSAANYSKKAKQLLKAAKLETKEYRKELAALKKQGIVSKYIDARTHKPTRYMLSKLRKYKDVATGHAMAIPSSKIPKERRDKYIAKGTARQQDKFLIVPKTAANQRADVVKGHLATYTKLGFGDERVIFLPYEAKDLNDIVKQLEDHESEINTLKEPNEQFGFQLFGHNAKRGFVDADDLFKYLTQNYSHLLSSPKQAQEAFKEFVLIRFRNRKGVPEMEPYHGRKYYGKKNERRDDTYYAGVLRKRAAVRKARLREKETPKQHEERLNKQREYDRGRANDRREVRIHRRLFIDKKGL